LHSATPRAPANKRTKERDKNSENKEERRSYVRQNSDVRIAMAGELIDRDQEQERKERGDGEDHSGPAKPVAKIAPKRPWLCGGWSVVRHREIIYKRLEKSLRNDRMIVDLGIKIDIGKMVWRGCQPPLLG